MIRLEVNNGWLVRDYEYSEGMTAADLIKQFQEEQNVRFKETPALYDASQNSEISGNAELVDGRYYFLNVWIEPV